MRCSSCGASVRAAAWICPACDYILDPSVFEPDGASGPKHISPNLDEPTSPPRTKENDPAWDLLEDPDSATTKMAIPGHIGAPENGFALPPDRRCEEDTEPFIEAPLVDASRARRAPEGTATAARGLGRATVAGHFAEPLPESSAGAELDRIDFDIADDGELDDVWSDAPSIRLDAAVFDPPPVRGEPAPPGLPPIGNEHGKAEPPAPTGTGFNARPPIGNERDNAEPPAPTGAGFNRRPAEPAPVLDPAFLREVQDPTSPALRATPSPRFVGPLPRVEPVPRTPVPRVEPGVPQTEVPSKTGPLPRASRGPIQEKLRSPGSGMLSMADRERVHRSRKKQVAQAVQANPADSVRMMKAQKLFEQALRDRADGNLISARMNMKLALTFDSGNELYLEAFEELTQRHARELKEPRPVSKSRAQELYEQATQAESLGQLDDAIDFLEQAIHESKQPAFYNRLGVLLATRLQEYTRAQELIEQALELSPGNKVYEQNLQKILARAATDDVSPRTTGDKKSGLLGFLGRRK